MKSKKAQIDTSHFSAIGKRYYQEDRYVLSTGNFGWLLAIMDGHNGDKTAGYCHEHLLEIFFATYSLIDTIKTLNEQTKNFESGSTISVVHIPNDASVANVAVLGDSPIIIKIKDGSIFVSPEHNVRTNLLEREAAIKRGGIYEEGYIFDDRLHYGLQMSRALGDSFLDSILNREPEVYEVELGPESFVAVFSDGVIDPGHKDSKTQIDRLIKLIENGANAQKLVDDALKRKTKDNATAVIWRRIK